MDSMHSPTQNKQSCCGSPRQIQLGHIVEAAASPIALRQGYQQSFELISLLLGYPTIELSNTIQYMAKTPQRVRRVPRLDAVITTFARTISPLPLADWQALYVQTFDLTPATSLHLTWHIFGDSPRQGRALAAINEVYRDAGFNPVPGELPDYLPMLLEFMAVAPTWATECLAKKFGNTIAYLAAHLDNQDNPYTPLLEHVREMLGLDTHENEINI